MKRADYFVKGYAGALHPAVISGKLDVGTLLVATFHVGDSSMEMEVEVWRRRMARGECSRIDITDRRINDTMIIRARPAA